MKASLTGVRKFWGYFEVVQRPSVNWVDRYGQSSSRGLLLYPYLCQTKANPYPPVSCGNNRKTASPKHFLLSFDKYFHFLKVKVCTDYIGSFTSAVPLSIPFIYALINGMHFSLFTANASIRQQSNKWILCWLCPLLDSWEQSLKLTSHFEFSPQELHSASLYSSTIPVIVLWQSFLPRLSLQIIVLSFQRLTSRQNLIKVIFLILAFSGVTWKYGPMLMPSIFLMLYSFNSLDFYLLRRAPPSPKLINRWM